MNGQSNKQLKEQEHYFTTIYMGCKPNIVNGGFRIVGHGVMPIKIEGSFLSDFRK